MRRGSKTALQGSMRLLTTALGLDDDSVEEVMSTQTFKKRSKETNLSSFPSNRSSRASSIASSDCLDDYLAYDHNKSKRDLACLHSKGSLAFESGRRNQEQAEGPRTSLIESSSDDTSLLTSRSCPSGLDTESLCDYDSQSSSQSNLSLGEGSILSDNQSTTTLHCHTLYDPTADSHIRVGPQSSKPSSLRQRHCPGSAEWPYVPSSSIKENPAFTAINAVLSGVPFADLILSTASDDWETHTSSFSLLSTCPALLQKIQSDDTLNLDVEVAKQSSGSSLRQARLLKKSLSKWVVPHCWRRGHKLDIPTTDGDLSDSPQASRRTSKVYINLIASESPLLPHKADTTKMSRTRRIQVTGCNGPDLRALIFYLYTGSFRLVPSHNPTSVDDSAAFRGQSLDNVIASPSGERTAVWDPIRLRKSPSVQDILWPDNSIRRCKRLSTQTIMSFRSTSRTKSTKRYKEKVSQRKTNVAPPFSVQGAYHLSQVLQLSNLTQASSFFFFNQLNPTNALRFYVSPFATAYPVLQSSCLDYLVLHWAEVSTKRESQIILGRLAAGWYPQANLALFQLLGKVG